MHRAAPRLSTFRSRLLPALLGAALATGLVATLGCPREASAQDADKFRELIAEATKLAFEGKYDAAITKYIEAKTIQDDPLLDFNIARCYHKLNQCPAAKNFYSSVLKSPNADAETRTEAEKYLAELGECPVEKGPDVVTNPDDGKITPDPDPGPADDGMTTLALAGWSTLGAGVLIGLGGLGLDVASAGLADDLQKAADAGDQTEFDSIQSDIDGRKTTIFVLYGLGGVAAVTGGVLLVLDATSKPADKAGASLTPVVLPGGGAAAVLDWRF